MRISATVALYALANLRPASAIDLDITDQNSIKSTASIIAHGMMNYYSGNLTGQTPGLLPSPYYWWEAGAMFGSLIDYWYYTGDTTYNDVVTQAMLFQVGPEDNYMPPNQTKSLGNDDQSFWGLAAMSAAELKFPNPPAKSPQWLALAQGVFNSQAQVWDNSTCNGGLRWQKFTFNTGYNYKNSISNGCFFNMASRLGFYTKNESYFDWANSAWNWAEGVKLLSTNGSSIFVVDGTDDTENCTSLNPQKWSYNAGVYLLGASVMYNQTSGDTQALWKTRVEGLIAGASSYFFENKIMLETLCEPQGNCDTDQLSFKAYLSRWMAASIKLTDFVEPLVLPLLQASAQAAAKSCSGGTDGVTCGTKWTTGAFDGTYGVGQQMSALEVVQSLLIDNVRGPVSNVTGGTSAGDPSAGTNTGNSYGYFEGPITTGSRAGAGVITAMVIIGLVGGAWWMVV
ncbi:Hypothetical protein R9X50_00050700 [Acrodontium crateriforme]|uniref:Mannan endo-1,6-alpha-mannosidase n=1 Tax=Acrodontium crateriforme TaxID=150365 RepID=A0AAQ3LY69_9PEZI|nr:Hypothetical protein R9X50_00050700 [Acrodontium crateriforme]